MPFKAEQMKVLRTIKATGNRNKVKVFVPAKKAAFGGKTIGRSKSFTAYFCQGVIDNSELSKNPNLVTSVRLLISPISDDGELLNSFVEIITSKSALLKYPDGREISIDNVKLTMPDNETPILARVTVGG